MIRVLTFAATLLLISALSAKAIPITEILDLSGKTPGINLGQSFSETASNGTKVDINATLGVFLTTSTGVENGNGFIGDFNLTFDGNSTPVDDVFATVSLSQGAFGNTDVTFTDIGDSQSITFYFGSFDNLTTFSLTALGTISSGLRIDTNGDTSQLTLSKLQFTTNDSITAVPLPASFPFLAAAIGGMALIRRRKKS
ncbi:VPLPA-CTERM sorting domain-containing protein [Roseibium sp. HPY-6]|uniref:VPLPA-CTERM sorting domain-containing protein n=1 Tax=Roseibium sp. HPY-6 TaxID=3229852 RepID=UPI00338DDA50